MEIHVTAILLQMLNFGLVVGALTYLLLKPVRKILDERSRKVSEGQAAAEAAMTEKEKLAELKKQAEREAKSLLSEARAEARKEIDAYKAELMDAAKAEVDTAKQKMLKNIEKEKATALQSLQADFEQAVLTVSQAVIGDAIDAKKHSKLISQGLKDIAATK